jgi:hypothetical protein
MLLVPLLLLLFLLLVPIFMLILHLAAAAADSGRCNGRAEVWAARVLQESSDLCCIWMLQLLNLLLLLLIFMVMVLTAGACLYARINLTTLACLTSAVLLAEFRSVSGAACAVTILLQMLKSRVAVVR